MQSNWFLAGNALKGYIPIIVPNPNGDPLQQVNDVANEILKAGLEFTDFDDTFYVTVEPGAWPQNKTANQQFLIKMIKQITVRTPKDFIKTF